MCALNANTTTLTRRHQPWQCQNNGCRNSGCLPAMVGSA